MHIGNPTDVKHVAHIGWDGNKDAPPTWMTGFKGESGSGSPNGTNSSLQSIPEAEGIHKSESEQKSRTASSSGGNGGLSRRSSLAAGEPGNKHNNRQTRRASRNGNKEIQQDGESKPSTLQSTSKELGDNDAPKKVRRKKAKESDGMKSKSKAVDEAESSSSQPDQSQISSSETAAGLSPVEEER
ncbi:CRIB domain-containing protein RIC7 [Linum grandiflorum]